MHTSSAEKPKAAAGLRPLIWLSVFVLHGAALVALSRNFPSPPTMNGGAPVIQLTLAPRASFDGVNAPQTSTASASASATPPHSADESPLSRSGPSAPEPFLMRPPSRPLSNVVSLAAHDPEAGPFTQSRHMPGSGGAAPGETSQASKGGLTQGGLTQGGGAPVLGAAAAPAPDAYEAAVLAWIERHKRHPGGPSGIVTVRFTLDRRGALMASEVLTSSGISSMDHAALSQLKDATPFPRPPTNALWRTRDFTVRLDFRSLRATR